MGEIIVVNKYKHKPTINDVYIGRGSPLGNPFTGSKKLEDTKAEFQCESREEAVEKHREYLDRKISEKDEVICNELNRIWLMSKENEEPIYLVCFCKQENKEVSCHGDNIKNVIELKLKNE